MSHKAIFLNGLAREIARVFFANRPRNMMQKKQNSFLLFATSSYTSYNVWHNIVAAAIAIQRQTDSCDMRALEDNEQSSRYEQSITYQFGWKRNILNLESNKQFVVNGILEKWEDAFGHWELETILQGQDYVQQTVQLIQY